MGVISRDCCCWPAVCRLGWQIILPARVHLSPALFCCLCLIYKGDGETRWIIQHESEAFKAAVCCVSRFSPLSLSPPTASPSPILSPRARRTSLCAASVCLSTHHSCICPPNGEPETPTPMLFLHFGHRKREESSRLSPLSNDPFVRRN